MKSGIKHSPFTLSQGNRPRMIVSPVVLVKGNLLYRPGQLREIEAMAQWDTGADYCLISPGLAKTLRLESCGEASINQIQGRDMKRRTYLVNLLLPNGVYFSEVPAIEDTDLKSTGVDFLIGMDVINEVDFALTHNDKGETILSISYPADRLVDFCDKKN